jgi:peptide/nickel transport system substrate-binding protein
MVEFKRLYLSVVVLILFVTSAGCTLSSSEESTGARDNDELVLAIGREPEEGFDPTTGWGRYGSPLFQSTLLKRDSGLRIVNDLATGYEVSADGRTWTVKLRGDVQFTDGQPLTAEDVRFTFETTAKNGSAIDLSNLEKVTAANDRTVVFHLKEANSTFVTMLISIGIVPKHAYDNHYASRPIGSGPYRLVQWDRGQQLIVEANPDYYGGEPFFRRMTFLFLNEDAAYASAKAGKVDLASIPAAFSKKRVNGMHLVSVQSVDNRGIVFPYVPSGGKTAEGYSIGNDVTSDPVIRKAMNIAVDRRALVEGILEGHGTPAYSANDGLPWWNSQSTIADADIEGAKRILAENGWEDRDGDGIAEKGQQKAEFTLIYPSADVTRQALALATADMVSPAGIRIQVEGKSWSDIEKLMHSQAVLFGWGSHDPLEMYNLHSSKYRGVDYYNPGFYSNPAVDQWMDQALRAASEAEALEYWKKAQWDGTTGLSAKGDAPWTWLVNINHLYLVSDRLDIGKQPIQPHGHGWPITDNITEWKWNP